MSILAGIGAGIIARTVGVLGKSFLEPILSHYRNKDTVWGNAMVAALAAEGQVMAARTGMLKTFMGALLIFLIIGGPGLYVFSIFGVTLLESFTGIKVVVIAVPPRWEAWAVDMMTVFIGGGSLVTATNIAAKSWQRR